MDANSLVFNLSALFASIISLGLSTLLAVRQIRISRLSNHLPVVIDLIYQQRSAEFILKEENLCRTLPGLDATGGISALPDALKRDVYEVGSFYQNLGYLVLFQVVEIDLIAIPIHIRIAKTWAALAPFVVQERALLGRSYSLFNTFETLVAAIGAMDVEKAARLLTRRSFRLDWMW